MATVADIQTKIDKVKADIAKREERDAKLKAKVDKMVAKLNQGGITVPKYNMEDFRSSRVERKNTFGRIWCDRYSVSDFFRQELRQQLGDDCFQTISNMGLYDVWYDMETSIADRCDNNNKLFELEDRLTKLNIELQQAVVKQQEVEGIPPILKELQESIYDELIDYYKNIIEKIKECKQKMRNNPTFRMEILKETFAEIGKTNYQMFDGKSEDDAQRIAEREAEFYVLDIINRVTKKVGNITDYSNVYVKGPAINGTIVGDRGVAHVETIVAGGYNIQRAHYRVLVK